MGVFMKYIIAILYIVLSPLAYSQDWSDIYETNPDVNSCEEGSLLDSEKQKILQAINTIRSAHNLKPVTYDYSNDLKAQKGALISAANTMLDHQPESSVQCFSQDGYDGNDNSNLYLSYGSASTLIDSYISILAWMIDQNVESLGHRRAIINPFIDKISFGRVDGNSKANPAIFNVGMNLYYRASYNNSYTNLEYVAYPQGNYPIELVDKSWYLSFHAIYDQSQWWNNSNVDYSNAQVEVIDEDERSLNVHSIDYDTQGWGSLTNQIKWKVDGLQNKVEYTVRISNVDVNGTNKDYEYTFNLGGTDIEKPDAPLLTSPANESSDLSNSIEFEWEAAERALSYSLQISEDDQFEEDDMSIDLISGTTQLVEDLKYKHTYYWRVAGLNLSGIGEWSEVYEFSTKLADPEVSELSEPENNSTIPYFNPILKWNNNGDYTGFELEFADNDFFDRSIKSEILKTNEFEIDPDNLEPDLDYYWRVKTFNEDKSSEWSEVFKFTSPSLPDAPTPNDEIETNKNPFEEIILSWNEIENASHYIIQIANDEDFMDLQIETEAMRNEFVISANSFNYGQVIYWRVLASNTGKNGEYSETRKVNFIILSIDKDLANEISLMVAPNPAKSFTNISVEKRSIKQIEVFDLSGNLIFEDEINNQKNYQLNTQNFVSGSYMVSLKIDNETLSFKLLVNK